ncbi:MAG: hypothetical protein KBA61_14705 [Spirochaetes bacterium]|nr:hypothetical protein [Spirochaetota bacterium]
MKKELDLMTKLPFDELIDHSIALYRKHFAFLIKIMAYFYVPAIVLLVFVTMKFNDYYIGTIRTLSQPQQAEDMTAVFSNLGSLFGYSFGLMALFVLLNMLASAAVIKGIDDKIAGRKNDEGDVAVFTLKQTVRLTVTTVIAMIMVGFGFIFCFIPGLVLGMYLVFVPQALMIEGRWGFGAVGRSFSSVNQNFWPTLLVVLIWWLAYFFISSLVSYSLILTPYIKMIGKMIESQGQTDPEFMMNFYTENAHLFVIQGVLTNILYMVLSPILNIALTLKFLNIRNLREGTSLVHDIEKEIRGAR